MAEILHLGLPELFEERTSAPLFEEKARGILGAVCDVIAGGIAAKEFASADLWEIGVALWVMIDGALILEVKRTPVLRGFPSRSRRPGP